MRFYLGTHMPHWLSLVEVPLFVSHTRLRQRRTLPRALGPWALDSGAFGEINTHGQFVTDAAGYVAAVRRYRDEIGSLEWAAQQDHMTEPFVLARSRIASTVEAAQRWTVDNLLELRHRDAELPIVPVLQGQSLDDYRRCIDLFVRAGIALTAEPVVGLGSVCRRQSTTEIEHVVRALASEGLRIHGFGVKARGLAQVGPLFASTDSLAWSFNGRRNGGACPRGLQSCGNCLHHALAWRDRLLAGDRACLQLAMW